MNKNITYNDDDTRTQACTNTIKDILAKDERKIYELSVKEVKELLIECFELAEQRKRQGESNV